MKNFLLSILVLFTGYGAFASHAAGGEIYWVCTGPNTFNIYTKIFRDCNPGNITLPTSISVGLYNKSTHGLVSTLTLNRVVNNQDLDLGDDCYTPTGLCIDEAIYELTGVTIANNSSGYYLETHINTRNSLADNLQNPDLYTLIFLATMEDPSLGQNSSPSFGSYPLDSYLCTNAPKIWTFPVVDADGDSLAYSLVEPLGNSASTGTSAGSGAYPYYAAVPWSTGYNLGNICGGLTPMSIDNQTGEVYAAPTSLGTYSFVVKVEEYRNGIKLGEVRREVQYAALNCTVDIPPTVDMPDTVSVYAGDSFCVDVTVTDADGVDTLYVIPSSVDFDLANTFVMPTPNGGNWQYADWNGTGNAAVMGHFDIVNGEFEGVGEMYLRYCWQPGCESVDSTYHVNLFAYSYGCSGSDTTEQEVVFSIQYEPAQITMNIPDSISVTYNEQICFDLLTVDNDYTDYVMSLKPDGGSFDYTANYVAPNHNNNGYYYTDFSGLDTVYIRDYSYSSGTVSGKDTVALRYCWTPGCGDVFLKSYELNYKAELYTECYTVYQYKTMQVLVDPPSSELRIIPNIFTPNGDGDNDHFKLGGTPDPCFDNVTVTIFNRWGKKVFESNEADFQWDGTLKNKGNVDCADGVYYVIMTGYYGSYFDSVTGESIPIPLDEQYTIELMR
ncbi:MAG: gliding motility-associated C-terminal domain-containing protein [Flavobacteriales bacterium]|nr:gliding motility-associated C-terminal domain-containing protein [Flavobacteriales bacterium]MCB9198502.1 gliding motility-associated C-terminal domain-containing protein [Flavobacteriales bacterium]